MGYPFGKDIPYSFYPLADDEPVQGIPAQTARLSVYRSRPSKADALAETGAVRAVNGTWVVNAIKCDFTIPAIPEPAEAEGITDDIPYWVVVKFILQTGGDTQLTYRVLELQRVQGAHQTVTVIQSDLEAIFPPVSKYATAPTITTLIADAVASLKSRLRDEGYNWAQIYRVDRLANAVKYKALSSVMLKEIQDGNGKFKFLYDKFKEDFEAHFRALSLEYDAYNVGEPTESGAEQNYVYVIR